MVMTGPETIEYSDLCKVILENIVQNTVLLETKNTADNSGSKCDTHNLDRFTILYNSQ